MKTVRVFIERGSDGDYSAYMPDDDNLSYGITGTGHTIEETVRDFKDAYEGELQAFVDCVRAGNPSPVDAYDGLVGIKLALAATESYRTDKPVQLTY